MSVDYRLYLVTDRKILGDRDFLQSMAAALQGGVTLLQLREKEVASADFYQLAVQIKELAHVYRVPLVINDRLDIALAVDADGLHIGQDDLPLPVARKLLGPEKILGYSVSTLEEARYGEQNGADYLGAGPVYWTGSKADIGETIGLECLQQIKQAVAIPVVGIAGINPANLPGVKGTGVDGVAVISGILGQADIARAARDLLSLWNAS